jgi:hypothetical protein
MSELVSLVLYNFTSRGEFNDKSVIPIPEFLRKYDPDAFLLLKSDADPDLNISPIQNAYPIDPKIIEIDKSWHSSAKIEKIFEIFREIDEEAPTDKIISECFFI